MIFESKRLILKKQFTNFCRRNLAFFRLAVQTQLEYRFNFITDALISPIIGAIIELTLWASLFRLQNHPINGFGKNDYLAYALWAAFVSRISITWMFESKMIEEIETGSINNLLTRPLSFFEYYMSQFMGYKMITTLISFMVPVIVSMAFGLPFHFERLPAAFLLIFYFLILVQILSFFIATLAFFLNRAHSFTVAKNLTMWLLSGELLPLDLLPTFWRDLLFAMPFANAVYIPTGYLTGRIDSALFWHGFQTTTYGILFFAVLAYFSWQRGIRTYAGTGA